MDPLTLKVLATLVQVHGATTVVSTNQGIDDLLGPVRERLQDKTRVAEDGDLFGCKLTHCKDLYTKEIKYYKYVNAQPGTPGTKTKPITSAPSTSTKRR
jgi:hypothetical protein